MCIQDILRNLCGVLYIKTRISWKFFCETDVVKVCFLTHNSAYNQTVICKIIDQTPFRFQLLEANHLIKPVDIKPPQKECIFSLLSCIRSFHISSTCSVCIAICNNYAVQVVLRGLLQQTFQDVLLVLIVFCVSSHRSEGFQSAFTCRQVYSISYNSR